MFFMHVQLFQATHAEYCKKWRNGSSLYSIHLPSAFQPPATISVLHLFGSAMKIIPQMTAFGKQ